MGLGDCGDQLWIEGLLAPELLAQQLQVVRRLRGRGPIQLGFGFCEQVGVGGAALALVQLFGQQGELLTAPGGPGRGHHGVLVVVEGAADRAQQAGLVQVVAQALVGGCRSGHRFAAMGWCTGSTG